MARGKVLQTIIDISGEISPTLGRTIQGVTENLEGVNKAAVAANVAIAAIGTAAVAGTVKAGKYLADLGDEYNRAVNDIAAGTGFMGDELEGMAESMKDIYAMNLGESYEDVADSMATAQQVTGLMGEELENVTAGALRLRDTFEYDVNESTRAARALMQNFGVSGEEAMNLIASGAQTGLDFSGEMLDTISEYSVQFAKVGLDAEDMFAIMQSGADGTAWNLDKVGDTIKEFSIRAVDGSKTTIAGFEAIGMDADKMMQIFAEGGEAANKAFYDVLEGLVSIEDPVARDAAGVNLLGTMWEDMGVDAIAALAATRDASYDAGEAMEDIGKVKYDNLGDAMEGIKRQLEVGLTPAASALVGALTDIAPRVGEMVQTVMPYLESLAGAIGPIVTTVVSFAVDGVGLLANNMDILLPIMAGLTGALIAYKVATTAAAIAEGIKTAVLATGATTVTAATVATWALNSALAVLTSPIFIVVAAIGALVAAGVLLYKNWDTVKMYAAQLGDFLLGVWDSISSAVSGLIDGIVSTFTTGFQSLAGIVKGPINAVISIVNGAINGINSIGFEIPDWVPIIGGNKFALNIPNMPLLASGGFTTGPSIAGEAGTEAVISFDPAYREDNLSYWAKAGRLLGATEEDAGFSLSEGSYTVLDMGGVTFAPNINITGKADKDSVIKAIEEEYPEFLDMLERWLYERGLPVFG